MNPTPATAMNRPARTTYAQIAAPFEWKFTTADLQALLARTTGHDHHALAPAA